MENGICLKAAPGCSRPSSLKLLTYRLSLKKASRCSSWKLTTSSRKLTKSSRKLAKSSRRLAKSNRKLDEEQPEVDEEQPEADEEQPEVDEEQTTSFVNARLGANLRSGPGVQFERVEGVAQGTGLTVVAQDASGDWLKLDSGLWVFAALVGDVPEDLPVDSGAETSIEAEDGTEDGQETQTEDGTEDGQETQTEDETEDEQQAQTEDETKNEQEVTVDDKDLAELATVNIDANLRNGPGLEATIVASVLAGTEVTVVGRAEDGQWLELGDGLWIFAALVEFAETEEDGEQEVGAGNGNAADDGSGTEETVADDEEEGQRRRAGVANLPASSSLPIDLQQRAPKAQKTK